MNFKILFLIVIFFTILSIGYGFPIRESPKIQQFNQQLYNIKGMVNAKFDIVKEGVSKQWNLILQQI